MIEHPSEKEEIRTILNQVFENEGIIFEDFDYDIDINYVTTGYGLGEHIEAKRVFKGIEANVDYINEFQTKGTEYVRWLRKHLNITMIGTRVKYIFIK